MVIIITNSSGQTWILPKGQPELDLRNSQVALMEAFEEAGVFGHLIISEGFKDFKRKCGGILRIYPLAVHEVLNKWPEKNLRKRKLVTIKEALSMVTRQEHLSAIKHFSQREFLKKVSREKSHW